jgi:hypothetical protein
MPTISTTPTPAVDTKTPETLGGWEKLVATILFLGGAALIAAMLLGFPSGDFTFKAKELKTVEEAGAKTTSETDFADSVAIFVLTAGAGLMLAGAFYGRLREITLGAFKATLRGAPVEEKDETAGKAEQKTEEKIEASPSDPPPEQKELAIAAAGEVAKADLDAAAARGLPPDDPLVQDEVAERAAQKVIRAAPDVEEPAGL